MQAMSTSSARWTSLLLVAAAACSESSDACISLSEEDILLTAYITDTGTRARAEVELRRAPDDVALSLCGDDALYVDDIRAARVRRPSGSSVYKADITVIGADPTTRTFKLKHDDGTDEYRAEVEAPAFEISKPVPGATLSRKATWELEWAPGRPDATISARVDDVIDGETCLGAPILLDLPDAGAAVIGSGEVTVAKEGLPAVDQCDAYVRLARAVSAPLAPTAGTSRLHPDSRVEASTSREILFTSVP